MEDVIEDVIEEEIKDTVILSEMSYNELVKIAKEK